VIGVGGGSVTGVGVDVVRDGEFEEGGGIFDGSSKVAGRVRANSDGPGLISAVTSRPAGWAGVCAGIDGRMGRAGVQVEADGWATSRVKVVTDGTRLLRTCFIAVFSGSAF